jgi:hypothetical protein
LLYCGLELAFGHGHGGLGLFKKRPVILGIQLDKDLPFFHLLVIVHQNPSNGSRDYSTYRGDPTLDKGIVRGLLTRVISPEMPSGKGD